MRKEGAQRAIERREGRKIKKKKKTRKRGIFWRMQMPVENWNALWRILNHRADNSCLKMIPIGRSDSVFKDYKSFSKFFIYL